MEALALKCRMTLKDMNCFQKIGSLGWLSGELADRLMVDCINWTSQRRLLLFTFD